MRTLATTFALLALTGCATVPLGTVAGGTSLQARDLDIGTCKDQAVTATDTKARIAGSFLMGLTVVGAPVAVHLDRVKERDAFAQCMRARGYHIS